LLIVFPNKFCMRRIWTARPITAEEMETLLYFLTVVFVFTRSWVLQGHGTRHSTLSCSSVFTVLRCQHCCDASCELSALINGHVILIWQCCAENVNLLFVSLQFHSFCYGFCLALNCWFPCSDMEDQSETSLIVSTREKLDRVGNLALEVRIRGLFWMYGSSSKIFLSNLNVFVIWMPQKYNK
jgi:hypothetical protein